MTSLELFCQEKINKLEAENKLRSLKDFKFSSDLIVELKGKKYHNFASNDYYGLASNEQVKQAAKDSIEQYGVGGASSRLVVGNYDLYAELEGKIAAYKSTEQALVFGSGYLTSISVLPALFDKNDLVIADKLIHACLLDGVKLSGAKLIRYQHNNLEQAEELLRKERSNYKKAVIITETVFSMDGDRANIDRLIKLAQQYDAYLLSDDAHGLGLNNKLAKFDNHIQLGTLSKGVGVYGGYVTGPKALCDYLATKARGFIYTTALPVPVVAAASKAMDLLEQGEVVRELKKNIELFAQESGLRNYETPIFIKEFSDIKEMQDSHQELMSRGFYTGAIRPPTSLTPRLRISISAGHRGDSLRELAELLCG